MSKYPVPRTPELRSTCYPAATLLGAGGGDASHHHRRRWRRRSRRRCVCFLTRPPTPLSLFTTVRDLDNPLLPLQQVQRQELGDQQYTHTCARAHTLTHSHIILCVVSTPRPTSLCAVCVGKFFLLCISISAQKGGDLIVIGLISWHGVLKLKGKIFLVPSPRPTPPPPTLYGVPPGGQEKVQSLAPPPRPPPLIGVWKI